ncbi:MAG: T9SS type A sorting domain-containing protein [Lewinellaceae bacterium]|nr:T9SS type A sorting domain-containing protein [Saprospiraceae bacterium]MCB9336952.1 T9SS type A sorting domain-containing protein [Lewinellaceae bacterium]
MKKLYFFAMGLILFGFQANAQVEVTFQVDLTDYLATNTLKTVKIAGNFAASGAVGVPDWTPPSTPVFTDQGSNVWSTTITFDAASVGNSLEFKFLNTDDSWGACDVDQECMPADAGDCKNPANDNRLLVIPAESTTICYKWNSCVACGASSTREQLIPLSMTVAPNPFSSTALVTFPKDMTNARAILTSLTGQTVRTYNLSGTTLEIEKEALQAGIYFLTVAMEEGRTVAQKLVVQ